MVLPTHRGLQKSPKPANPTITKGIPDRAPFNLLRLFNASQFQFKQRNPLLTPDSVYPYFPHYKGSFTFMESI
jgi:hypothetical protein